MSDTGIIITNKGIWTLSNIRVIGFVKLKESLNPLPQNQGHLQEQQDHIQLVTTSLLLCFGSRYDARVPESGPFTDQ